jgi:hypothetical protein
VYQIPFEDASRLVLKIRETDDIDGLKDKVFQVIQSVGGEVFVFHFHSKNENGAESYRYLIGCSPAFCQNYNAHKWREIDPVLTYAKHHMRPASSSEFKFMSQGQQELMKAAKNAGFYFSIGIPTRDATNTRLGILYVGSKDPESEAKLNAGQGLLMHLSSEMLEWVTDHDRKQMIGDIELDITDQRIMRYSYQGFTAEQIADLCEIPLSRVRNRMRRQNEKFGTTSHKKSVSRAIEMGLLRMHECLSDTTPNQ